MIRIIQPLSYKLSMIAFWFFTIYDFNSLPPLVALTWVESREEL